MEILLVILAIITGFVLFKIRNKNQTTVVATTTTTTTTTTVEQYSLDWFIQKFEQIDPDLWIVGSLKTHTGACCVLGWCGVEKLYNILELNDYRSREANILASLFEPFQEYINKECPNFISTSPINFLWKVNDGVQGLIQYFERNKVKDHPKARILYVLNWLKNN